MAQNKKWTSTLLDAFCVLSIVGIWPRFIEPKLLSITSLNLKFSNWPSSLSSLKICHFSDLHWSNHFSEQLIKKIKCKIDEFKPDFIFFTGDFLSRSRLESPDKLLNFLNLFHATYGCYAVLGNHDYDKFVTVNADGYYDVEDKQESPTVKGFKKLFERISLKKMTTDRAKKAGYHNQLIDLLKNSPFHLLNNASLLVPCKGTYLNICGLEEYSLDRSSPSKTFAGYDSHYPGISLVHNPDAAMLLKDTPTDLILSGHTHGGQINLPILWRQFTHLENPSLKRGLKKMENKLIYINRGIASVVNFRLFSKPELTFITINSNPS